jgi:hypothetical protein
MISHSLLIFLFLKTRQFGQIGQRLALPLAYICIEKKERKNVATYVSVDGGEISGQGVTFGRQLLVLDLHRPSGFVDNIKLLIFVAKVSDK